MNNFVVQLPESFSVAMAVLANYYGVDPERREKLKNDGYDPDEIQDIVNDLVKLIGKAKQYDKG